MKKVFVLIILIIFIITSCSGEDPQYEKPTLIPPTSTLRPTRTPRPTPTNPPWSSCGVALVDHDVKMWAEGNLALEACGIIASYHKSHAELPIWWTGEIVSSRSGYYVVCSDDWSNLIYEVIDNRNSGWFLDGVKWCNLMTETFGVAPYPVDPDIFGLIGP